MLLSMGGWTVHGVVRGQQNFRFQTKGSDNSDTQWEESQS